MTPKFINSTPIPFHAGSNEDHLQYHHFFGPSSSSSPSSHNLYFNNSTPLDHHQAGCNSHHQEFYPSPHHLEGKEYVIGSFEAENKVDNGLQLTPETNKVGRHEDQTQNDANKWMYSKMRAMHKMKSTDLKGVEVITTPCNTSSTRREDRKRPSSCMEAEYYSSSISSSSNNVPVRVCSDCNTTKTPLWRSGPKGPKSLCNACGIRQRKARRAMAAAAAAGKDTPITTNTESTPPAVKIKVHHHKEKAKNNNSNNGVAAATTVPFKKRCVEASAGSSSSQDPAQPTPSKQKKVGNNFEEYLIKLSKNLSLQHVFPQDEKEAAILLMAISCGLVHG